MDNNGDAANELEQQQQQLLEIEQLLEAAPNDQTLLDLKTDLLELIAVTTANSGKIPVAEASPLPVEDAGTSTNPSDEKPDPGSHDEAQISGWSAISSEQSKRPLEDISGVAQEEHVPANVAGVAPEDDQVDTQQERPHKKKKSSAPPKEFVIPPHLQPDEKDSNAEANRKKRAIKALKNQWRTQRKEQEAYQKQKSWQDFQKRGKGSSSASSSIFSTSTDANAKVGVVGGRNMTDFASRKRHK
ncbi:hypothetical protein ACA910_002402 [Epithemia clementina (nom. ined.)]